MNPEGGSQPNPAGLLSESPQPPSPGRNFEHPGKIPTEIGTGVLYQDLAYLVTCLAFIQRFHENFLKGHSGKSILLYLSLIKRDNLWA
jgi:hypothetical protein